MLLADAGQNSQTVAQCRAQLNDDVYQQIDRCSRNVPNVAIAVLVVRKKLEERQSTQEIRFSKSVREANEAMKDALAALAANHPKAVVHTATEVRRDVQNGVFLALHPAPALTPDPNLSPSQAHCTPDTLGLTFAAGVGASRVSSRLYRMAEMSLSYPLDSGISFGILGRVHISDAKRDLYTSYLSGAYRMSVAGTDLEAGALAGVATLENGEFTYDLGARGLVTLPLGTAAPFLSVTWTMRAPSASIGLEVSL